jgi:PST family polysaccharide transporter
MGALGSAELINRLTRILTAIVLARTLGTFEFGVAAVAITVSELLRILTQSGIGARIIQASEDEREAVCNAAYRLNWLLYGLVVVAHCIAAYPVASAYGDLRIAGLILLLALPLMLYPLASVQVFLTQRRNDMSFTAKMLGVQTSLDNVLTALFALAGLGLWSVALPKLFVALVWVWSYRRRNDWRPSPVIAPLPYRQTIRFGAVVLLSELAGALRLHADKFLIGAMAGINALGTWFFAFNAGLGLSASIITALSTAFLPHVASLPKDKHFVPAVLKAMGLTLAVVTPVIVLQAVLAPIYVPILFGSGWTHAAELVGILCLSALALPVLRMMAMVLRALGTPGRELIITVIHGLAALSAVSAGALFSLEAAAWALVAVNAVMIPAMASAVLIAIHRNLRKSP